MVSFSFQSCHRGALHSAETFFHVGEYVAPQGLPCGRRTTSAKFWLWFVFRPVTRNTQQTIDVPNIYQSTVEVAHESRPTLASFACAVDISTDTVHRVAEAGHHAPVADSCSGSFRLFYSSWSCLFASLHHPRNLKPQVGDANNGGRTQSSDTMTLLERVECTFLGLLFSCRVSSVMYLPDTGNAVVHRLLSNVRSW